MTTTNSATEGAQIDLDKPDTLAGLLCCLYEGPEIQRAATMLIEQAMQIEELTTRAALTQQAGAAPSDTDMPKQWHERTEKMDDASIIQAMKAELSDLRAQLASAQKDAARYRYLREFGYGLPKQGNELDKSIDAARAQITNPTGK
jgi:hypothetical protein